MIGKGESPASFPAKVREVRGENVDDTLRVDKTILATGGNKSFPFELNTFEYALLEHLTRPMTVKELSRSLGIWHNTVRKYLMSLRRRGLVDYRLLPGYSRGNTALWFRRVQP